MSLIKDCRICGQKISLRKMPHGKYVPFDVKTNNHHTHTRDEIKKIQKKQDKNKKKIELKKENKVEEDYSPTDEEIDTIYEDSNPEEMFKDDTLDSLKKEIEIETTGKKSNKNIIYALIILAVVLFIFLN